MALAHLDVVQLCKDPFRFLIANPSGDNADLHLIFSIHGPWSRILIPHAFFLQDFLGFQIKGASTPFAPITNAAAWGQIPNQISMLPNEIKKAAIKLNTEDLENLSLAFSWLNLFPPWFNPIPPVIPIDVAAHDGQKVIGGMTLHLNIQSILSLQE